MRYQFLGDQEKKLILCGMQSNTLIDEKKRKKKWHNCWKSHTMQIEKGYKKNEKSSRDKKKEARNMFRL